MRAAKTEKNEREEKNKNHGLEQPRQKRGRDLEEGLEGGFWPSAEAKLDPVLCNGKVRPCGTRTCLDKRQRHTSWTTTGTQVDGRMWLCS